LKRRWAVEAHLEVFEQNPFLTQGFYEDPQSRAFNTEVFFLLTRFKQQKNLVERSGTLVSDYIFQKNWIFAQMNLSGEDKQIYHELYDSFQAKLRKPDLVVLLQADLETLLRRIYFRDREFERALSPDYLEKLAAEYYRFFASYSEAPVLRVQTSGLDFVKDPGDLEKVCTVIEQRIRGQVQLSLNTRKVMKGEMSAAETQ